MVEPGDLELRIGTSSEDVREVVRVHLTGPIREVDGTRALTSVVTLEP